MAWLIQLRKDTAANWTSTNPTLADGEAGYERDTKKLKFGDGTTAWNSLAYFTTAGAGGGDVYSTDKDATGGFVGLTLLKLNMKNVAGTFTSFLTNMNTAARTYTWPDKDGTVAMVSDITGGTAVETATHAATSKATPVDADELPLVDSAAANALKRLTWLNLKATLKAYFDTVYQATGTYLTSAAIGTTVQALLVSNTNIKTINSTSILGSGDISISGTAMTAKDEGTTLTTAMTSVDFVGAGVTATNTGGAVTVTITGGGAGGDVYSTSKDASGGFVGLTLFRLNMKNVAGTFTSTMSNYNTAVRTYLWPDKDGTVAMAADIPAGITAVKDQQDGMPGLTGFAINFKNALGTFKSELRNSNTAIRAYTFPDVSGTVALTSDITTEVNRDGAMGVVGLTNWYINFKNYTNTAIVSYFRNTNSVSRTYTFPDKDGTVAMTSDITGGGISAVITGYTSGAGTVAATDTILQAIQKLNGNIAAIPVPPTSTVALGNSGTTAQALNWTTGRAFTLTNTGAFTLTITNMPAYYSELQLKLVNGGANTITMGTTITYVRADTGVETPSLATYLTSLGTGRTALFTSGTDQFVYWSYDGTTIYGKLI